ncbi:uncharacterized protein LOC112023571 [Quercus suber]|uniref:uncharacterized protein LOC112023571 n=1 Tax=Quercus suber TaxID=58331 RepID=UPI000CE208CF|nr:uncharacterized protein LOC112023571 [Quercus suber]
MWLAKKGCLDTVKAKWDKHIIDNIAATFESLHYLHHHKSSKDGFMAFKLDMSKAYDHVEWAFIEKMIRKLGFNEKWITLMMLCVSAVSYSILINGAPNGFIRPTRGIRQLALRGDIHGFSICRRSPTLTHLLFANDSLLFYKSNEEECEKVLEVLQTYERSSGQQINKVVASMAEAFPLPFSITTVEVIAAGKALKLARDLALTSIVLEGDSKTTIDALLCESPVDIKIL